jgi:peptide alpha-N-acetyltransferase
MDNAEGALVDDVAATMEKELKIGGDKKEENECSCQGHSEKERPKTKEENNWTAIAKAKHNGDEDDCGVNYVVYESELEMPDIMRLIQRDLSEPYSIYTYRYFIHNWPHLCLMARVDNECVGAIVCKLDFHRKVYKRGYIAMLAVDPRFRKRKIGSTLVRKAIEEMTAQDADEVVLETEITNRPALRLYENLGFVRDKRLFRYYLNGVCIDIIDLGRCTWPGSETKIMFLTLQVDALRLKLWLR